MITIIKKQEIQMLHQRNYSVSPSLFSCANASSSLWPSLHPGGTLQPPKISPLKHNTLPCWSTRGLLLGVLPLSCSKDAARCSCTVGLSGTCKVGHSQVLMEFNRTAPLSRMATTAHDKHAPAAGPSDRVLEPLVLLGRFGYSIPEGYRT